MRRIPNKAKLESPKPIIVKIDPEELRGGIVLPKIRYEIQATVEKEQVFHGMVLPIPRVLIYYLNRNELIVLSAIIEDSVESGHSSMTVRDMAARLKLSVPTLSHTLYVLRRVGLLLECPNGKRGAGRVRKLNYDTIQHLNDLVEGEDPGIYSRIRKASKKIDITHMSKADIREAYDHQILEPDHDPIEEEEYD